MNGKCTGATSPGCALSYKPNRLHRHQVSSTAGTIFQGTRKPLQMWFRAMWRVTSQKNGASAKGLQQSLGLGSYQTAWAWLHKLRRVMVRPGRDQLSGLVEVDETYVGGPEKRPGRGAQTETLVVIAVEKRGRALGRTRMAVVREPRARRVVRVRGRLCGAWQHRAHRWLAKLPHAEEPGLHPRARPSAAQFGRPQRTLPGVHRLVSLLKRWLLGTHQGAVSRAHLPYYLDEFTFRFNRRKSRARGKLFFRLVEQALAAHPAPYKTLIKPNHNM